MARVYEAQGALREAVSLSREELKYRAAQDGIHDERVQQLAEHVVLLCSSLHDFELASALVYKYELVFKVLRCHLTKTGPPAARL